MRRLYRLGDELAHLYDKIVASKLGIPGYSERLASSRAYCDPASLCRTLYELEHAIKDSKVCVIGPNADTLPEHCEVYAAPEGGLDRVIELGVRPLYVTLDMDSATKLIHAASMIARYLIVHLHSDNYYREHPPRSEGIVYTTQAEPLGCAVNIGGFTDGDRALTMAMMMNASRVEAYGYGGRLRGDHKEYYSRSLTRVKALKYALGLRLLRETAWRMGYVASWGRDMVVLERRGRRLLPPRHLG